MTGNKKMRLWPNLTAVILSVALTACVMSPRAVQAQEQLVSIKLPIDSEVVRSEIIAMLELQYQVTLDLPFTPMTEASLLALDMAISGVASASSEELGMYQSAGLSDDMLMTNVQKIEGMISAEIDQYNSNDMPCACRRSS